MKTMHGSPPVAAAGDTDYGSSMIIDKETFTDICLALKLQSDVVLQMAKHLATEENASPVLRQYITEMNHHVDTMDTILTAVKEENHIVTPPSGTSGRA